jgi:flagellar hook-associated protein 3
MQFRVTYPSVIDQTIRYAQQHGSQLARLQEQISSGIVLHRPSDDPLAFHQVMTQDGRISRLEAYRQNIVASRAQLDSQVSQLISAKNILVRAKELAMEGRQQEEASVLANEVDHLIDQLVEVANSQFDGKYLFSGAAFDQRPYRVDGSGAGRQVVYQGGVAPSQAPVADALQAAVHLPGSLIFGQENRGTTVYIGTTGAQAGSGTDSGVGRGELTVTHLSTQYAAGSGLLPGSDSVANDTILGPLGSHQVTITDTSGTGAFGTISLNGGPPVDFTSSDTNLRVEGLEGEVIYVDMSAITPGFSGVVSAGGDGLLSTDGGATTTPIGFAADQAVQNSVTGGWTYVNSTGIRQTGTDYIEYAGTGDAFQALIQLRDDLLNSRQLSASDFQEALSRRMQDIDRGVDSVLAAVGEQSALLSSLETAEQQAEELQLAAKERASQLRGTDYAEATVRMQEIQNLLQFTYASSVRFLSTSLLDFLGP